MKDESKEITNQIDTLYKLVDKRDFPAVGDWVALKYIDNSSSIIKGILSRNNVIF